MDISWLAWPSAVVLLGGYTLHMFRPNIAKLIDRTETAKVPGIELTAPTQPQVAVDPEAPGLPAALPPAETSKAGDLIADLPPASQLVLNIEQILFRELDLRAPTDPTVQRAMAVRALAVARVLLAHEANYRVIFSTQIMLLKSLNDRSVQNTEQAMFWYNVFHQRLPDAPITFEQWLLFLQNAGYVQVGPSAYGQPSSLSIDPLGHDFLLWLVGNGISEARPG